MRTVNLHEAKTQLSKLVARAVQGEPFIIAEDFRCQLCQVVRAETCSLRHQFDHRQAGLFVRAGAQV
jgi:hypothetical protein